MCNFRHLGVRFMKECKEFSITSAYCCAVACRTAVMDDDHKRWRFKRWKTKVPAVALNFFPGFIGTNIVSSLCTWHSTTQTSSNASPFLETVLPSSNTKLHTSSRCTKVGTVLHVHVALRLYNSLVKIEFLLYQNSRNEGTGSR